TRLSLRDFESVYIARGIGRFSMSFIAAFIAIARSKPWAIAYSSAARTEQTIRLHFTEVQWTMLMVPSLSISVTMMPSCDDRSELLVKLASMKTAKRR